MILRREHTVGALAEDKASPRHTAEARFEPFGNGSLRVSSRINCQKSPCHFAPGRVDRPERQLWVSLRLTSMSVVERLAHLGPNLSEHRSQLLQCARSHYPV